MLRKSSRKVHIQEAGRKQERKMSKLREHTHMLVAGRKRQQSSYSNI